MYLAHDAAVTIANNSQPAYTEVRDPLPSRLAPVLAYDLLEHRKACAITAQTKDRILSVTKIEYT